jgi:RNA polymerase sigma-70 factor (ECF subfamily)
MDDLQAALERARAGDTDAIGALYRAYAGQLLSYLSTQVRRRHDAEDLLGEVFVQAMRDLAKFEGDLAAFRGWLYRIASNRAIDLGRRTARRPEEPLEAVDEQPAEGNTADEAVGREERDRLWAAVQALPPAQRDVVGLRLAGGLTSAEIAEILDKPVGAVKALQHRALVNLTKALGAYPEGPSGRLEPMEETL